MIADVVLFSKAVLAGFVVAVPIGAIGAICIRHALSGHWSLGMLTGLGTAVADAALAAAAVFGLTLITAIEDQAIWRLIGGVFLVYLGFQMMRKRQAVVVGAKDPVGKPGGRWRQITGALGTGFGLTIINPATLIAFAGVFASLGLFADPYRDFLANWSIIVGSFCGSMVWWTVLTTGVASMRQHLPMRTIAMINAVVGLLILGLGGFSIFSAVERLF